MVALVGLGAEAAWHRIAGCRAIRYAGQGRGRVPAGDGPAVWPGRGAAMAMIRYGLAGAAVILVLGLHALTSSAAAPNAATGSPTPTTQSGCPVAAPTISPTPVLLGTSMPETPLGTSTPPGTPTPTASITPTPSATATLPPLPPGPSATRDDCGLRLTIGLPPGPYFRSELLPVALTVVNRGSRALSYGSSCFGPLFDVRLLRGRGALLPLGLIDTFGCGPGISFAPTLPPPHMLPPGGSLAFRTLIGLPVAGRIVVEGQFATGLTYAGSSTYFAAGWPGVAIIVAARTPTGRTLAVTRRGHSVYLAGYPASLPPAVGEEATAFVEPPTGACLPGALARWSPLRGGSLHDDGCRPDEHQEQWRVLIGAPGYAIFTATYCFNPVPSMVFGGLNGTPFMRDAGCTEVIHEPGR